MSTIFACIARIFGRHNQNKRRPQSETPKRQSNTSNRPVAPATKNTYIVEAGSQSVGNTTQGNEPVATGDLPIFAQLMSAEPDAHSDIQTEVGENIDLLESEDAPVAKRSVVVAVAENTEDPKDLGYQPLPKTPIPKFTIRKPTQNESSGTILPNQFDLEHRSHSPSPSLEEPRLSRKQSDASSKRSRSHSEVSSIAGHWLKDRLEEARIECPRNPHSFLIPKDKQDELITVPNVTKDILATNPEIGEVEAARYANDACRYARQLFATLAYIKKGSEICDLLNEGLTDEDLPLVRKPDNRSKFALRRKNGEPIPTMMKWKDKYLEKFDRVQWWMTAPIFVPGERHVFDAKTILPFVPFPEDVETQEKKQGAYSKVYPVIIHPAHHDFPESPSETIGNGQVFAVKELFSSEKAEFLKEATILEALGLRNHRHLIKLLATYEKEDTYHLLFPYANANLRKYWDDYPEPKFDKETVLWMLRQMTGIASAIVLIHHFRVTEPLSVMGSGKGNIRNPGNAVLSVEGGEQWFGRHGDIKPENILWFKNSRMYSMGILQIADFGLGRFHGRDSRSGINPEKVVSSPTYEPPECKLRQPVSRTYDIWSLGCVFLEFITWLLKGNAEIDGFSEARGRLPTGGIVNDDDFFTVTHVDGVEDAVVREGVQTWVAQLHAHEKCSQAIHDLLDLIMKELLVIDSKKRSKANWLHNQLMIYLAKAERDEEYLLKPNPTPIPDPEADSKTLFELPNGGQKRNSVTFSEIEISIRPRHNTHPKSQPNKGRPVRKTIGHPYTWPEKKQQTVR